MKMDFFELRAANDLATKHKGEYKTQDSKEEAWKLRRTNGMMWL